MILNVADSMSKTNSALAICLDADKAFDSVRWEFLYLALQPIGCQD